ncbi:transposase [Fodinisporobacter ferrooxydans]|uniref:Transposase n=1 Tax=Fodinisporobacter ferrooxydans TaxID=2901836 RepID=A0ABY4CPD6_9BACL|nr:transposase [Alicyclobacillaceae bacterium MYW30-H2]
MNEVLSAFRSCFSRTATFEWFIIIIVGLMLRTDRLGVTTLIRDLSLHPRSYETLIHFFRSSAWSLESLRLTWLQVIRRVAPLFSLNGAVVLVGDGMKQAKEARRMPGVKKLHQESENSSKAQYIFGHLFGAIGILMGTPQKWFCLPLFMNLQDGVKTMFGWSGSSERQDSHVVQMMDQGFAAAKPFGKALLLLDRYFLSVPALKRLNEWNAPGTTRMHIITKAKSNTVAYEYPSATKKRRGRPRKKGAEVKRKSLFQSRADAFQTAQVAIYGKDEAVPYLCLDLLWGQGLYQKLRFVLVQLGDQLSILVSTDLTLEATDIIRLYGYRFKIECTFREMKQAIGGFSYHYCSKSMSKLKRYLKKGEIHPLEQVTNEKDQTNIRLTVKAIEGYVMCSCIAMGLLQLLAVKYSHRVPARFFRYLRTPSFLKIRLWSICANLFFACSLTTRMYPYRK